MMCHTEAGHSRPVNRNRRRGASFVAPALALLCAVAVLGCTDKGSFQAMAQQPRDEALENSDFYPDQSSAKVAEPDTVARGELRDDTLLFTGKVNNQYATAFPFAITADVLLRGQQRFNIFCAPCHDYTGTGNGLIVQAGFPHPPSLHEQRIRDLQIGIIFEVITKGFGRMPAYAPQVDVRDRWAIIAYLRALQLSQNARIDDVPADQRNQLGQPPR